MGGKRATANEQQKKGGIKLCCRQNKSISGKLLAWKFKSTLQPLGEESLPLAWLQFLIITKRREIPTTILWLITLPTFILYCISNKEKLIRLAWWGILSTFEFFSHLGVIGTNRKPQWFSAFPRRQKKVAVPMKTFYVYSNFFFFLKKSKLIFLVT